MPEFVKVSEAAKLYGCTTQNLYKHIRKGNLRTYHRFGTRVVRVDELMELAEFVEPRGDKKRKIIEKKE